MKKIIIIVLFIIMGSSIYYIYENYSKEEIKNVIPISGSAYVNNYYIYGTSFNLNGYLENPINIKDIKLILYNNEIETEIPFNYDLVENQINFYISNLLNTGYQLDNTKLGDNYLLFKITFLDDTYQYYRLENQTEYEYLKYYTLSTVNHLITINTDNNYNTFNLKTEKNKDENIYDITIDPGHGGKDPGACSQGNCEKSITLEISKMLKEKLESSGLKVNLTRDEDETIPNYNMNNQLGRAVIPNESNSKYLFSIHLNSHVNKKMYGVEILSPGNIDYTFAKNLADRITQYTASAYSINKGYKLYEGVYFRKMTAQDVADHIKENGELSYNVKEGANYYFMIRETGGILTGAYIDNRNVENGENPYYNSNKGVESYILELGYIINKKEIQNILNNKEKYVNAIYDSIMEKINSY